MENFRGFERGVVDLDRPLTVLLGGNGSGKTSVLDALRWALTEVLRRNWGPDKLTWAWTPDLGDLRSGADAGLVKADLVFDGISTACYFGFHRRAGALHTTNGAPNVDKRSASELLPIFYDASRRVEPSGNGCSSAGELAHVIHAACEGFRHFFQWFKSREDAENRLKVQQGDLSACDPQLAAVRRAVELMLPGYTHLRAEQDPMRLDVRKGEAALSMNQLSHGERLLILVTADIARLLAIAYPHAADPSRSPGAVVLVDEVELHLHAEWQRRVLPLWTRLFPTCQFIIATHSLDVIRDIPRESVVLLEGFELYRDGSDVFRRRIDPGDGHDRKGSLRRTRLARSWRR